MRRSMIGFFTAVVVFILFVVLCTFVRRPYETVLLDRFGTLIPQERQARIMYNWHLKLPTDRVVRIDSRLHLYTGPLQQVVTARSEPISIRTFATWRIVDPVEFYKKTGGSDQRAHAIMDERIRALVGQKLGRHNLDELFNTDETRVRSADIEEEIAREATGLPATSPGAGAATTADRVPGLLELGMEIVEIGFSRMAFPPSNTEFVYQRMVAELNKRARDYESQGVSAANIKRKEGEQEAARIRSEALTRAEDIKGSGDREALQVLASAQPTQAAREFYQFWKSLEFLKASLLKNTVLVLSSDSALLQTLFLRPDASQSVSPIPSPSSIGESILPMRPPGAVPEPVQPQH